MTEIEYVEPVTFTHPDVYTIGVSQGWAEAEIDPTRIDWPARQAVALIPFILFQGRPVSPGPPTGIRHGRNQFGRWGENAMADAIVTLTHRGHRHLLMVERGDGAGWAVPGGAIDPGERPLQASVRELQEETGLVIPEHRWMAGEPRYVPDPRGSDEAWAVTVANRVHLGDVLFFPDVTGADDAKRAAWIPAADYDDLAAALGDVYGGAVFAAHIDLLREHLDTPEGTP